MLDSDGEVSQAYGVRAIPNIVLIDQTGAIRYQGHQLPSVEDVEKLL